MSPQAARAMQTTQTSLPAKQAGSENTYDRIQEIYDSIARRAFEIFDGNGRWNGHELEDWFRAESELLHPVHLNLAETDENLTLQAEVPGFSAKEPDINVEPNRVTITGNRETRQNNGKGQTIQSEWCANQVLRVIDLPTAIDSSKAIANLKDGILTLELPKIVHSKPVHLEPKES